MLILGMILRAFFDFMMPLESTPSPRSGQRTWRVETRSVSVGLNSKVQVLYTDRERYEAVLHNHRRVHEQAKQHGKVKDANYC